jgi:hypothetical protein
MGETPGAGRPPAGLSRIPSPDPATDNNDTLSREERGTITMAAKKKAPAKKAKKTSKKK